MVKSVQLTEGTTTPLRLYPTDLHGKLRIARGTYTAPAELAAGTTIEMLKLPAGRITLLGHLSRYSVSALGAGRTLDIGHLAYIKGDQTVNNADQLQAADVDAFVDGDDVSSAVTAEVISTNLTIDLYSKTGITLTMTVLGDVIDAAETFELVVLYVQD